MASMAPREHKRAEIEIAFALWRKLTADTS
jgi:hypothetical protein